MLVILWLYNLEESVLRDVIPTLQADKEYWGADRMSAIQAAAFHAVGPYIHCRLPGRPAVIGQ